MSVNFGDAKLPPRFWDKVELDVLTGCWNWTAQVDRHGYGRFTWAGRRALAHRCAYIVLVGDVPAELVMDHLCRVRRCANPAHLEVVTTEENTRRGRYATATHCRNGHAYDEANTYVYRGNRSCRACNTKNEAAYRKRKLEGLEAQASVAQVRAWAGQRMAHCRSTARTSRDKSDIAVAAGERAAIEKILRILDGAPAFDSEVSL